MLYSFRGEHDGDSPRGGVVIDASNNLYGTAFQGGLSGFGVVFQLTPNTSGEWHQKVLHRFANAPAADPVASLVFDNAGNLYGTTMLGANLSSCASGCGPPAVWSCVPITPSG